MKALVRDAVGGALSLLGVTSPRRFGKGRLNVATFHRVLPEDERRRYPHPELAVTPEELTWYLDFFARSFTCTTLAGAHRLFEMGAYPERPLLAITFDDAQADNFHHARPVLEAKGLRASFYVPVDAVERRAPLWHDRLGFAILGAFASKRAELAALVEQPLEGEPQAAVATVVEAAKAWTPDVRAARVEAMEALAGGAPIPEWAAMMSWAQIRTLADAGHEIGSHSMSHALLPQLSEPDIEREVTQSKARIEAAIDRPVRSFCYPNGDCDDRAAAAVARAGYACAVTTAWGSNARGADPHRLRRCDMNAFYARSSRGRLSEARLAWRMSGLHPGL